jgi:hypothetical protein
MARKASAPSRVTGEPRAPAKGEKFPCVINIPGMDSSKENGVAMYGGFAGWETVLDERDWENHLTILRRDVPGSVGVGAPILLGVNLAGGSRLDGFVVQEGWNWMPNRRRLWSASPA